MAKDHAGFCWYKNFITIIIQKFKNQYLEEARETPRLNAINAITI